MKPPWEYKARRRLELTETAWHRLGYLAGNKRVTPSLFLTHMLMGLDADTADIAFDDGVENETAARMAWNRGEKI